MSWDDPSFGFDAAWPSPSPAAQSRRTSPSTLQWALSIGALAVCLFPALAIVLLRHQRIGLRFAATWIVLWLTTIVLAVAVAA